MPRGMFVVKLDKHSNLTEKKILEWTAAKNPNDKSVDELVALNLQVGGWMTFSNSLFANQEIPANPDASPHFVNLTWDPPGDDTLVAGPSQHTYFDEMPLSSRAENYQQTAINWFAEMVLARYLTPRHYMIEPHPQVVEALGGRLPATLDDVHTLICQDLRFLDFIRIEQTHFSADMLSTGTRKAIGWLLESRQTLEAYLQEPTTISYEYQSEMTELEVNALIRAATDKPELIQRAFDSVELGRASGDGNTYILLGVDRERHLPNAEAWAWLNDQLPVFAEMNGFLPAFGCFITQARQQFHVILGPGVTDREKTFLEFYGNRVHDYRDGSALDSLMLYG